MVFIGKWAPAARGKVPGARLAREGSLATLKVVLKNKCDEYSVPVFDVNEAYSTITCSECGMENKELKAMGEYEKLDVREWTCPDPDCNAKHDRDVNAAINIRNKGMKDLKLSGYETSQWDGKVERTSFYVAKPDIEEGNWMLPGVMQSDFERQDANL